MDREFLERWSREWVIGHDPEHDLPLDDEVRAGWLGFGPATPERIAAAERRLGRALPPSLRAFLLITDGWKNAGNFIYRLAGTSELAWTRDTDDAHWADAYHSEVVARSLRISLGGDASLLFLDPLDVGDDGEWAAYSLASWSGVGPERYASFDDLMLDLYAGFHALRQPPGETRDHWDAEVERARRAALAGEIDGPAAILTEAQRYGRDQARLLRLQLCGMRGDWYTAPLSHLFLANTGVVDDPIFEAELLPLVFAEDRLTHRRDRFTLERLRTMDRARPALARYEARERVPFGNPEFDGAVQAIVDDLRARIADAVERARPAAAEHGRAAWVVRTSGPHRPARDESAGVRGPLLDEAWPRLRAAMPAWRPVSTWHIAPIVLFAEPLLAEMITPERGRELLRTPRG